MTAPTLRTHPAGTSDTSIHGVTDHGVLGLVNTTGQLIILIACWVGVGLVAAVFLGRRGHEFRPYAALGAVLGPMFVFLAYDAVRRRESERPITISSSLASPGSPVLVVAVGSIENPSATIETLKSLGEPGEVYAAVPTTYEVGERVHRHGTAPPVSDALDDLAFLLAPYGPGLMMLPGPLEKSVPAAVGETGAVAVVLIGEESTFAAPGLEESMAAEVVRVDSMAR